MPTVSSRDEQLARKIRENITAISKKQQWSADAIRAMRTAQTTISQNVKDQQGTYINWDSMDAYYQSFNAVRSDLTRYLSKEALDVIFQPVETMRAKPVTPLSNETIYLGGLGAIFVAVAIIVAVTVSLTFPVIGVVAGLGLGGGFLLWKAIQSHYPEAASNVQLQDTLRAQLPPNIQLAAAPSSTVSPKRDKVVRPAEGYKTEGQVRNMERQEQNREAGNIQPASAMPTSEPQSVNQLPEESQPNSQSPDEPQQEEGLRLK